MSEPALFLISSLDSLRQHKLALKVIDQFLSASSLASASISPFVIFCFLSLILFVTICSVCHNMQCLLQFVLIVMICSVGLNLQCLSQFVMFIIKCCHLILNLFNHLHKFMAFIVMSFLVSLKSCQILSHFLRSSHFVTCSKVYYCN